MNLDLLNNLVNSVKENNVIQSFIKELSNYLEKENNKVHNKKTDNTLKQENCIYQVVEMDVDGAYLQNTENNCISKETDISREILNKIGNDSVLRFKNGSYIYEEELTKEFYDSLIDVREYKDIQDNFIKESN